jgi:endonuclease YncB( thermonuclease family)/thiol-disulfide isomerase/thioredoxin
MKLIRSLAPLFLLCLATPVNALVLRGLVSEVPDGKTLVFISSNRKLTVTLEGVDAPDLMQDYGEVARQHLASLVLGKDISIELTELKPDHLMGKVICNQLDIGLQVIRDGVAWYYKVNGQNLDDLERQLYAAAEQAARTEQRGLWQDGTPMPPWEWRRAQVAKKANLTASRNNRVAGRTLSKEDVLFMRNSPVSNTAANPKSKSVAARASARLPAKPTAKPLNIPGRDFDFSSYLNQGRISVVYFYADWCPTCRQLSPLLDSINAQVPDMQVLFMDISDWNTPVTHQYGITYVPYLKIYDQNGNLIVEGHAARSWLQQAIRPRM